MNIHEYNKTFYYGLASLIFLGIISLLTYLFKFKNIQILINLFILFIVLLLVIYCHATFKNNVIENFDNSASYDTSDISNIQLKNLTIATADEPFGRFNLSFFGFDDAIMQTDLAQKLTNLYASGFRGFHFYVEYPTNSDTPYCVFPYKDTTGMDSIATRNQKILLTDVVGAISDYTNLTDPCFFCFTCLSREKENEKNIINSTLSNGNLANINSSENIVCSSGESSNVKDISFNCLTNSTNKHIVTLGTYDNIPLTTNAFNDHYFIKEYDLKYASFNVANKFGVYAPLLNYTKDQQDMFNSRGYDEDIISSVTLAYENGVQFVCIPPTKNRGNIDISYNDAYDYPTTVEKCKTYFTDAGGNVCPYKERVSNFVSAITNIYDTQAENKTRIDNIESSLVSTSEFIDLSVNFIDLSGNFYDVSDNLTTLEGQVNEMDVQGLRGEVDNHTGNNRLHLSSNQRRKIRRW